MFTLINLVVNLVNPQGAPKKDSEDLDLPEKKDVHVKEKIDSGDFTEQSHSHMTLQASLKLFISVLHCLGLSRGLPCETTDRTFSCESLWP